MVKHIAFTMYPVKDMARARKFYEDGLGLVVGHNLREAWIEYYLDNGCFALTTLARGVEPSGKAGGSIAFEVEDVDKAVEKLLGVGAVVKVKPRDTPVCRMAIVLDCEGNALCLHAKSAKTSA